MKQNYFALLAKHGYSFSAKRVWLEPWHRRYVIRAENEKHKLTLRYTVHGSGSNLYNTFALRCCEDLGLIETAGN